MQEHLFFKCFVWSIIIFPVILFAQNDSFPEKQTIEMEVFEDPDIPSFTSYGNCQWLHPLDEPNETLLEQPDYKSEKLYYYAAKYGDSDDNIYTIVIDESLGTGEGYDTVYVDLDNDNRIDPDNEKFLFQMSTTRTDIPLRIKLTVSAGGKKIPYYFNFTAFPYTDENNPIEKIHANARNSSIFTGMANFEGQEYKIAIADLDSNGLFNDVEQGLFHGDRFFVDFDNDGNFRNPSTGPVENYSYGKYTKIKDKWYSIVASADGTMIQISTASPEIAILQAPRGVRTVNLQSAIQSLQLSFLDGKADAVAGIYDMAGMELSMADSENQAWTATGNFRDDPVEINLKHGEDTVLPDVLPFTVSIEPSGTSPFDEITLTAKIVTSMGGTFRTPRTGGQANGGFEVRDSDGEIVASETFEFG